MAELSDAELEAALNRGIAALGAEPRAAGARYDATRRRIVVDLVNGCTFTFPAALVEAFEDASSDELSDIEVLGQGFGLRWEALDVDLSVAGLLAGVFGPRSGHTRISEPKVSRANKARRRA
jgi:hypothetical protein